MKIPLNRIWGVLLIVGGGILAVPTGVALVLELLELGGSLRRADSSVAYTLGYYSVGIILKGLFCLLAFWIIRLGLECAKGTNEPPSTKTGESTTK